MKVVMKVLARSRVFHSAGKCLGIRASSAWRGSTRTLSLFFIATINVHEISIPNLRSSALCEAVKDGYRQEGSYKKGEARKNR